MKQTFAALALAAVASTALFVGTAHAAPSFERATSSALTKKPALAVKRFMAALESGDGVTACSLLTKRAEAESGQIRSSGHKVRDEAGNHLVDLEVVFDLRYPEGAEGDAARAALPMALQRSNDRLCTVSRTVQIGTPVRATLAKPPELSND